MFKIAKWFVPGFSNRRKFLNFLKRLNPDDIFLLKAVVRIDDTLNLINDNKWKCIKKNFKTKYMVMKRTLCFSPKWDDQTNSIIVEYRNAEITKQNMYEFYEPLFECKDKYGNKDAICFSSLDNPQLNIMLDLLEKDINKLPIFEFFIDDRVCFLKDDGSLEINI